MAGVKWTTFEAAERRPRLAESACSPRSTTFTSCRGAQETFGKWG